MGELLSSQITSFDPTSDLTWADIKFTSEDSILVRLKCAKSSEVQGEFLDVFSFFMHNPSPNLVNFPVIYILLPSLLQLG
jgi:hypothetical protein